VVGKATIFRKREASPLHSNFHRDQRMVSPARLEAKLRTRIAEAAERPENRLFAEGSDAAVGRPRYRRAIYPTRPWRGDGWAPSPFFSTARSILIRGRSGAARNGQALFRLLGRLLCSLLSPLTKKVSKQQATQSTTAQYSDSDQKTHEPTIFATVFFFFGSFILAFVLVLGASLFEEVGQKQTTHPPSAQYPAGDQKPQQPAIFPAGSLLFFFFALVLVLFFVFMPLSEKMSKKQSAHSPSAQHAAANQ
jgi:hypothetical protein